MDLFSRAILGAVLAPTLEAQHALAALQQAHQHTNSALRGLIHHSDHGVQYTSHDYQNWLGAHGLVASTGEVDNSYDNAYAERVIGILKQAYGLAFAFVDEAQARQATTEGVYLYNHERPIKLWLTLTRWMSIRDARRRNHLRCTSTRRPILHPRHIYLKGKICVS